MNSQTITRFWDKVNIQSENGCWIWTKKVDRWGYGLFVHKENGTRFYLLAHRVVWQLCYGKIPEGLLVCHHCDNPPCVNPKHLFLGTDKDNAQDCIRKGRKNPVKGEKHPKAKLTAKQALEIKTSTENRRIIAEKFGITPSHVNNIQAGRTWKHI